MKPEQQTVPNSYSAGAGLIDKIETIDSVHFSKTLVPRFEIPSLASPGRQRRACYHVHRTITISAPGEQVFDVVSDDSRWTIWSPWLGADQDAKGTAGDRHLRAT